MPRPISPFDAHQQAEKHRRLLYGRDGGCCRLCRGPVVLDGPDPRRHAHVYALDERGSWLTPRNTITVCTVCYQAIAEREVSVTSTRRGARGPVSLEAL